MYSDHNVLVFFNEWMICVLGYNGILRLQSLGTTKANDIIFYEACPRCRLNPLNTKLPPNGMMSLHGYRHINEQYLYLLPLQSEKFHRFTLFHHKSSNNLSGTTNLIEQYYYTAMGHFNMELINFK